MTIGTLEGTLTRQYQIGDLVESLATAHSGMRLDEVQASLDAAGHDAHTGLAERLFTLDTSGGVVDNELLRSCREGRPDAQLLVWAAILIADCRLADVVETVLTDSKGHLRPDAFDARSLSIELDGRGYGSTQKAASNLLRYFETGGLLAAERYGSTIVGVDHLYPTSHAVPGVVALVVERAFELEGVQVAPEEAVEFAIDRRVNHWLLLSAEEFGAAALTTPSAAGSPSGTGTTESAEPIGDPADPGAGHDWEGFKPKDESDYVAHVTSRTMTKSRLHETVVNAYAVWAELQGFVPTSPHPVDLLLTRPGQSWLVEAKVVYKGNATAAVRAAIGQLFSYRHFLYDDSPLLVALFSESVGDAYVEFLGSLGIAAVWWDGSTWRGSADAVDQGFAELEGV